MESNPQSAKLITQETSSPHPPVTRLQSVAPAKVCRGNQGFSGLPSKINAFPPGSVFTVPILGKRRLRASCASWVPFRVADYTSSGFVNTAAFSTSYPAEHGPVPIVSEKEIGRIGV